jgi:hypothetical protein
MGKCRVGSAQASVVKSCGRRRSDFPPRLTLDPIGFLRSPLATKVQAARQPRAAAGTPARIELLPGRNFEHALEVYANSHLTSSRPPPRECAEETLRQSQGSTLAGWVSSHHAIGAA